MLADIEALIEPFLGERMIQEVVSVMLEKGLSESFCVQIVMEAWERVDGRSSVAWGMEQGGRQWYRDG